MKINEWNDGANDDMWGKSLSDESDTEKGPEKQSMVLKRDTDEVTDILARTLVQRAEILRDDLRDKGMEDGPEMEEYVHEQLKQWETEAVEDYTGRASADDLGEELIEDVFDDSSIQGDVQDGGTEMLGEDSLEDLSQVEVEAESNSDVLAEDSLPDSTFDHSTDFDYNGVDWDSVYAEIDSETQAFREMEDKAEDADESQDTNDYDKPKDNEDAPSLTDVSGWIGEINPNFDAFDPESPYCNNCGSCAYAVYQRLEGSSDSCASAENIGYNSEMTALTGMEQVSMSPAEIEQRLLNEGDGAHAIIGIDRAQGPGHWFNAACLNGRVVAIDGQTGEISDWPPDYGDVVNWEMSVNREV